MRYSALSVKEKLQGAAAEHPLGSLVGKLELFWIHEPGRLDLVDHCPDSGDQVMETSIALRMKMYRFFTVHNMYNMYNMFNIYIYNVHIDSI
jgi:hypothetical protein